MFEWIFWSLVNTNLGAPKNEEFCFFNHRQILFSWKIKLLPLVNCQHGRTITHRIWCCSCLSWYRVILRIHCWVVLYSILAEHVSRIKQITRSLSISAYWWFSITFTRMFKHSRLEFSPSSPWNIEFIMNCRTLVATNRRSFKVF